MNLKRKIGGMEHNFKQRQMSGLLSLQNEIVEKNKHFSNGGRNPEFKWSKVVNNNDYNNKFWFITFWISKFFHLTLKIWEEESFERK